MTQPADAVLLCGLLALKLGYIDEESLARCLDTWASRKDSTFADLLLENHCLTQSDVVHLTAIVEHQVARHGADVAAALQRLPVEQKVIARLSKAGDADLLAVLGRLSSGEGGNPDDPHATLPPTTSQVFESRFEILKHHKRGGLGDIFLARDRNLPRHVALKEIRPENAFSTHSQYRFVLEGEVTGALEHPGIVPVYDMGRYSDGRPYYAMRFIRGQSLAEAIKEFHSSFAKDAESPAKRLALRKLLRRFQDLCNAVAYAHSRGVLHRDIKPDNVMLGTFGETLVVDWGLAKHSIAYQDALPDESPFQPSAASNEHQSRIGSVVGTRGYMSPEQATGRHDLLRPTSDVYSLGVTLWVLVTNEPPFSCGDCDEAIARFGRQRIPLPLLEMCEVATSPSPEKRFSSAREFAERIEQWLADEPLAALRAQLQRVEDLVRLTPEIPELREGLARHRTNLGLVLAGVQRQEESEELLRQAVEDYERLLAEQPEAIHLYPELINAGVLLSRHLGNMGRTTDADDVRKRTEQWIERFVGERERGQRYRPNLANIMMTYFEDAPSTEHRPAPQMTEPDEEVGERVPIGPGVTSPDWRGQPPRAVPFDRESVKRGNYEFVEEVGRGGMGRVILAYDRDLYRHVVLKQVMHVDSRTVAVSLKEARIMAQLEHPNIPSIYGIGVAQHDAPFIAMQYIRGETLSASIRAIHSENRDSRDDDIRRLLSVLYQVCETLDFAHRHGVVHGDPKPSNIVLDDAGAPKVLDWGLAAVMEKATVQGVEETKEQGMIRGTPAYMSPEQGAGESVTPLSDIYCLGCVLFEILTGRIPFQGRGIDLFHDKRHSSAPRPSETQGGIPKDLDAICMKAMARIPEDRYKTAKAMGEDIFRWLNGRSVTAKKETLLERVARRLSGGLLPIPRSVR